MKQHISSTDLEMLTDKGKERLREWWKPGIGDRYFLILDQKPYEDVFCQSHDDSFWQHYNNSRIALPLLSCSQMIEFLDEQPDKWISLNNHAGWIVTRGEKEIVVGNDIELCDALWQAVVEILNKEEE